MKWIESIIEWSWFWLYFCMHHKCRQKLKPSTKNPFIDVLKLPANFHNREPAIWISYSTEKIYLNINISQNIFSMAIDWKYSLKFLYYLYYVISMTRFFLYLVTILNEKHLWNGRLFSANDIYIIELFMSISVEQMYWAIIK